MIYEQSFINCGIVDCVANIFLELVVFNLLQVLGCFGEFLSILEREFVINIGLKLRERL